VTDSFLSRYRHNRERSRAIFDLLTPEAYYSQPITLRHPIVFYDGHLPAFSFNTLVKKALGGASIDPALEVLFARGIDPVEQSSAGANTSTDRSGWPDRDIVRGFTAEADRRVEEVLTRADLDRPGDPLLDRAEAVFTILEHEAMHQETLLYIWHRLPFDLKRRPAGDAPRHEATPPAQEWIDVPPGCATLGVDRGEIRFGWDNEFPARREMVPSFSIERHNVTNAQYREFVEAGGYEQREWWRPDDWEWIQREGIGYPLFWERRHGRPKGLHYDRATDGPEGPHYDRATGGPKAPHHEYTSTEYRGDQHEGADDAWYWRGMFDMIPLPLSWPVYVSHAEASAYARWRGCRLPTEAEYQRAAFGTRDAERLHPWGDEAPTERHGVFDFSSWDPEPAGSHPAGASAWGIEDLVGNGWEWTSTPFAPFPGFRPMPSYPEYSADFFDGEHFVMKGASPATARELLRPTFRNWFRPRYPYVYASFRCVNEPS
jgi:iron(II)-dependent oxidoreductase